MKFAETVLCKDQGVMIRINGDDILGLVDSVILHLGNDDVVRTFIQLCPCEITAQSFPYPGKIYSTKTSRPIYHVSNIFSTAHIVHGCCFGTIGPIDIMRCTNTSRGIIHNSENPYYVHNTFLVN